MNLLAILSYLVAAGAAAWYILMQTWRLHQLIKGGISPEEFERGRIEWGTDPEMAALYSRVGRGLVTSGETILGQVEVREDPDERTAR